MKKIVPALVILLLLGCDRNHQPIITGITCSPEIRNAGTVFTLNVSAADEDGDLLNYLWNVGEGSFTTTTNSMQVKWKSPTDGAGKTYSLTVAVSDGKNEATSEFQIQLTEPQTGNLLGHVYFTKFNIPIPEATVTIGDKSTQTDQYGYFPILSIPSGVNTMTISKLDYSTYTSVIEVTPNSTVNLTGEISSVNHSTKLSGMISDQDGLPLEYAQVVVLNPDGTESKLACTTTATGYFQLWYIPHGERTLLARKAALDDYYFIELKESLVFQEIETQLNLVLQKVAFNGQFTDSRDNHLYNFKTIGNLTWMTENLCYLPRVSPSASGSNTESFFYVYDYQGSKTSEAKATENFKLYGVLYNGPAAREACPTGWHLPYQSEWTSLLNQFGTLAGKKLKSKTGWSNNGNGDNTSGFSAFPGGFVNESGVFNGESNSAKFWSSTYFTNSSYIYVNELLYDDNGVSTFGAKDRFGGSVRCVRNK
jgi:uncharacterized protein (TIGR02145 family)